MEAIHPVVSQSVKWLSSPPSKVNKACSVCMGPSVPPKKTSDCGTQTSELPTEVPVTSPLAVHILEPTDLPYMDFLLLHHLLLLCGHPCYLSCSLITPPGIIYLESNQWHHLFHPSPPWTLSQNPCCHPLQIPCYPPDQQAPFNSLHLGTLLPWLWVWLKVWSAALILTMASCRSTLPPHSWKNGPLTPPPLGGEDSGSLDIDDLPVLTPRGCRSFFMLLDPSFRRSGTIPPYRTLKFVLTFCPNVFNMCISLVWIAPCNFFIPHFCQLWNFVPCFDLNCQAFHVSLWSLPCYHFLTLRAGYIPFVW